MQTSPIQPSPDPWGFILPLLSRFLYGYVWRIVQIPLIAFYVFPLVVIIIALQENHLQGLSEFLSRLLFIGTIQADGSLYIHGLGELAAAVGVWLLVIHMMAIGLEWWLRYTKSRLTTSKIASGSLFVLYLLAMIGVAVTPHQSSLWALWAVMLFFYLIGLGLLKLYSTVGLAVGHSSQPSS